MPTRRANDIGAIYSTGDAREAAIVVIAADFVCTRMQQQVQKGVFRTGASCALSSSEKEISTVRRIMADPCASSA